MDRQLSRQPKKSFVDRVRNETFNPRDVSLDELTQREITLIAREISFSDELQKLKQELKDECLGVPDRTNENIRENFHQLLDALSTLSPEYVKQIPGNSSMFTVHSIVDDRLKDEGLPEFLKKARDVINDAKQDENPIITEAATALEGIINKTLTTTRGNQPELTEDGLKKFHEQWKKLNGTSSEKPPHTPGSTSNRILEVLANAGDEGAKKLQEFMGLVAKHQEGEISLEEVKAGFKELGGSKIFQVSALTPLPDGASLPSPSAALPYVASQMEEMLMRNLPKIQQQSGHGR